MRSHLLRLAVFGAVVLSLPLMTAQDGPKKNPFRKRPADAKANDAPAKDFADKPTAEQVKFFEAKIRPVLVEHCYKCHAADSEKVRANLTLDTRDGLRHGGDSGPTVVPGNAAKSLLIDVLTTKDDERQMPPKKKLPDAVIADLKTWVEMGAPDPRDGAAKVAKHDIDIAKGREFWAFQVPKKPAVPTIANPAAPIRNDVDAFLQAGWAAKNLKPVGAAEAATLVRRLYLDLIGLPPTPEEVEAYAADKSPDAYAKLVDKLLASPHFGERWGRHWLDVARYGESTGKAVNFNYPHAWRYRDYVIKSFNGDKPYDLFVKEQLAGDLLPAKDDADKAENTVATGFLAIGTKTLNERSRLQFEMDLVDEQIDAFSQAFLGITAACARCHDHKFDPIPTKDYYALAGIFRSTETCYGTIRAVQGQHPSALVPLPKTGEPDGLRPISATELERLEKQLKSLKDELAELQKKSIQDSFLSNNGVRLRIQTSTLEAKIDLYEKDGTPKRLAMATRDRYRTVNSQVFQRGEIDKPGEVVARGNLQVLGQPLTIRGGSGRLELANAVASKDNPLTARVYVNRVWLHLFGRGLVATPDNFGTTGQAPSNQVLLDHLAVWFTENGWSTKKLIRHLVTTHAYQLATTFDPASHTADPDNALLWRMSPGRLDAEVIRDSLLAVSGKLDRTPAKGSPTHTAGEGYAIPRGRGMFSFGPTADDTQRSVYLPIIRDNLPESLSLFDAADPNLIVGDRTNTTVPSQALFLMNNPFVIKQAEATAANLLDKTSTDSDRVRHAYRLMFGRPPTAKEMTAAEAFVQKYGAKHSKRETWTTFCQAMFGSAEFLMRN